MSAEKKQTTSEKGGDRCTDRIVYLSDKCCTDTFKNVLRGGSENNVYLENKPIAFREHASKQKQEKNLFDDQYKKQSDNSAKYEQKFKKNYVQGNLKTNIIFDDQYKSNTVERLSHLRLETDVEKRYGRKDIIVPSENVTNNTQIANVTPKKPAKEKFLNDTFKRNPIEVLSAEQQKKFNQAQQVKSQNKFERVSNYLGSDGVKASVTIVKQGEVSLPDKITNVSLTKVKNAHETGDAKKYQKTFKHVVENNRVFYY